MISIRHLSSRILPFWFKGTALLHQPYAHFMYAGFVEDQPLPSGRMMAWFRSTDEFDNQVRNQFESELKFFSGLNEESKEVRSVFSEALKSDEVWTIDLHNCVSNASGHIGTSHSSRSVS